VLKSSVLECECRQCAIVFRSAGFVAGCHSALAASGSSACPLLPARGQVWQRVLLQEPGRSPAVRWRGLGRGTIAERPRALCGLAAESRLGANTHKSSHAAFCLAFFLVSVSMARLLLSFCKHGWSRSSRSRTAPSSHRGALQQRWWRRAGWWAGAARSGHCDRGEQEGRLLVPSLLS
jgi:hypothetical protein